MKQDCFSQRKEEHVDKNKEKEKTVYKYCLYLFLEIL